MTTRIHHELAYDAPVEAVHTMLLTPEFRERVGDAQHVLRRDVTVEGSRVVIELVHASTGVPAFAQKFVGEEITIVQEEHWESPTSATITVTVPGKPGDMAGGTTLAQRDGGTVQTVALQVKVGIPLIGGKVESLIAGLLTKALTRENEVGRAWLAGDRGPGA